MSWTSLMFSGIKQYDFEYDGLNRLTIAQYADGDKYSTTYEYDKNGNIDHLERWMEIEGAKQQIDDLVYHYHSGGNQLKFVNDNPTLTHHEYGFADNGSFQNTEYNYDENGNMTEDLNKGIDLITYNHLNLPTHIYFANNGTAGRRIGYVYTADGIKLRKYTHLKTNAEGPVTDYVGAFVYENSELQFIQTSEGRLVPDGGGGYNYEYALKNLPIAIGTGNTRVMFDQTGEVLQDQSYYPFGLSMGEALTFHMPSSLPDNKYLYNGKELQDDFDLGWYDYGARFYDPALGRFHTKDRFTEKYIDFSPYQYAANNPIMFIDVNGDSLWISHRKEKILYVDGNLYNQDGSDYNGKALKVKKDGTTKLKGFVGKTVDALNSINGGAEGAGMLREIEGSTQNMTIVKNTGNGNGYNPGSNKVMFDPKSYSGGLNTRGGTSRPAFIGLGHEMAHGLDDFRGTLDLSRVPGQTFTKAEHFATDMENKLRAENGLPLRTHYAIDGRTGSGIYPLIDASGNSLHNGGHNYYGRLKITPKRILLPAARNPETLKPR